MAACIAAISCHRLLSGPLLPSPQFRGPLCRGHRFKRPRICGFHVHCRQATGDALLVKECIQKLSYATGLQHSHINKNFTVSGIQCLFGMEGKWNLTWCMDGRFYEKYDGQEVTYEWGFDGKHNPWYADFAGRVTALELDDSEISQLAVYVRTGFWLTDEGQEHLDIQIEGQNSFEALEQQIGELILSIHVKDKKVVAHITIDACQWIPLSMEIKILGQIDRWEYKDWRAIAPGFSHKFPHSCVHYPAGGGRDSYIVHHSTSINGGGKMGEDKVESNYLFAFPNTLLTPRYNKHYPQATIDSGCPPDLKMVRAKSGQLLIRPLIDGEDIGYFVLDTGASGLSVSPKHADFLSMEAFGEVFITGFDGQVCIDNLVTSVEPVVGVCGFDVFKHSIVEISSKEGRVSLFDHSRYKDMCKEPPKWERIFFLQNVPNVPVKINGQNSILLLDTGAAGVDVILHSKAENLSNLQFEGLASIKGINSTGEHQVNTVILDTLEIAGYSFKQVQAVDLSGNATQLHLSEYTSGILCMELLTKFTMVFDYSKSRVGFIDFNTHD
eukprot:Gb_06172 [translate_table: standard]